MIILRRSHGSGYCGPDHQGQLGKTKEPPSTTACRQVRLLHPTLRSHLCGREAQPLLATESDSESSTPWRNDKASIFKQLIINLSVQDQIVDEVRTEIERLAKEIEEELDQGSPNHVQICKALAGASLVLIPMSIAIFLMLTFMSI